MNIDTDLRFKRYLVASYGQGSPTVKDTVTGETRVVIRELMPTDEEGFAALFAPVDNLRET